MRLRPAAFAVLVCLALTALAGASTGLRQGSQPAPEADAAQRKAPAKKRQTAKERRAAAKRRAAARRCKRKSSRGRRPASRRTARRRRARTSTHSKKTRCRKHPRKRAKKKPPVVVAAPPAPRVEGGVDDAVVVAVLDSGINPYHHDFHAKRMPQHTDAEPANDMPLDRPVTDWLPGAAGAFASLDPMRITLSDDPAESAPALHGGDGEALNKAKPSTAASDDAPESIHGYWMPGTKIIGAVNFSDDGEFFRGVDAHGVGTTSSVVGNLHGTCPECLLVFVDTGDSEEEGEAAIDWVMRQPWIDLISNSYGYALVYRDRIYSGSSTELQRQASERGQTIFFSAGNGNDGAFIAPNTTTYSSQEGPDWIVTVGAVSPPEDGYYEPAYDPSDGDGQSGSYTGAGKPADVAGIGADYPTAYTASEIGGTGASGFGGTSNATPQVAGLYARALYDARRALAGPSRTQQAGVVASGAPFACGPVRPECELADGSLTGVELRTRMFHGAVHTPAGFAVYTAGATESPTVEPVGEEEFLNEGHGSYMGRVSEDRSAWLEEYERLIGPIVGRAKTLERPGGELEWMIVDSYCRQQNWGEWSLGYYVEGRTPLPGPDPQYPMRSTREQTCPGGAGP